VLVANAGGGRGRPTDTKASTLDPALLQLVTEMNLFGTVYSCNAVAPIMKQQRSGKIITVSSVAGTAYVDGPRLARAWQHDGLVDYGHMSGLCVRSDDRWPRWGTRIGSQTPYTDLISC